jgi:hypothetical protein
MEHYVGLDASLKLTAICIVDQTGKIEREGMVASNPEAIAAFIKLHAPPKVMSNFAGVSAGSNADVRSLPPAEVAIASILAAGLWALQTRSWRRPELHMKTARIKSTNRASRIGGTTRQEHRAGE